MKSFEGFEQRTWRARSCAVKVKVGVSKVNMQPRLQFALFDCSDCALSWAGTGERVDSDRWQIKAQRSAGVLQSRSRRRRRDGRAAAAAAGRPTAKRCEPARSRRRCGMTAIWATDISLCASTRSAMVAAQSGRTRVHKPTRSGAAWSSCNVATSATHMTVESIRREEGRRRYSSMGSCTQPRARCAAAACCSDALQLQQGRRDRRREVDGVRRVGRRKGRPALPRVQAQLHVEQRRRGEQNRERIAAGQGGAAEVAHVVRALGARSRGPASAVRARPTG